MERCGYKIDPDAGLVYGRRGQPIRRINTRGYVEIIRRGKFFGLAHRWIWEAANGPIPSDKEINHINGIKTDNRIENLEAVTHSENCLHKYRIGLARADGENNGRAKLTAVDVSEILALSLPTRQIASMFGVSRRTIRDIKTGKNWAGVLAGRGES